MNEKELKEMIAGISAEMAADNQAVSIATVTAEEKSVIIHVTETTEIEEGLIPDITEVDLRKQLPLKNAADPEALSKMKAFSPACSSVGRVGTRYMTSSILRFRADHAAAQDAVFSDVSGGSVKGMSFIFIKTICNSKGEYLTRSDYGRQFNGENSEIIRKNTTPKVKIQMVVGDGLSPAAIEANTKEVLPAIKQRLNVYNLDLDDIVFVKYCRVPVMDKISEITDTDVVCLLAGERPSLVTAEFMSAYIAYKPTVGMLEARWTVTSNICKGGTPAAEAGAYITEIIKKMLDRKKSGIDLKEAE